MKMQFPLGSFLFFFFFILFFEDLGQMGNLEDD